MSASKLLAIGLNDNPSQQSYVVMRRNVANLEMPSRKLLMERGHILNDLAIARGRIMSSSLIFHVLT